ncbi:hypothetical protein AWB65_02230 [Caballeronia humi]|uniref:Lipoprotein n=1 Tax=Caballeronia humi TaxID=326474 RepID=A0A158GPA4_9BURK|nr:hypothetical protein AWB65_02230 [Caballeronia humi]
MKSAQILATTALGLFALTGTAYAQGQPGAADPTNAAATSQSTPDTSYGAVPDTRKQMGRYQSRPCRSDPQCNVFFGR